MTPSDLGTKLVKNVGFQLKNSSASQYSWTYGRASFYYEDGTSSSSYATNKESSYVWKYAQNPTPSKNLTKIDVELKSYVSGGYSGTYTSYMDINVGNSYYNTANISKVSLDLPDYKEFKTHFSVDVDVNREGDDDVWFDLIDINGSKKTYNNSDFGKTLPIVYPISSPKRLDIYLKPKSSSPTKGGTSLRAVYWKTNDPKSL